MLSLAYRNSCKPEETARPVRPDFDKAEMHCHEGKDSCLAWLIKYWMVPFWRVNMDNIIDYIYSTIEYDDMSSVSFLLQVTRSRDKARHLVSAAAS